MPKDQNNPPDKAIAAFLTKKGATPTERKIYLYMVEAFESSGELLQNRQIIKVYNQRKKSRTTVLFHLNRMIEKKMVARQGKIYYMPLIPKAR